MTLRPGSLTFLIIVISAFGQAGVSYAQSAPTPKQVYVYVDSVMAADTNEGTDPRLGGMDKRLRGLFGLQPGRSQRGADRLRQDDRVHAARRQDSPCPAARNRRRHDRDGDRAVR